MNVAKEKKVFVNVVDPMAQGGTAWSKTAFLKEAVKIYLNNTISKVR